MYIIFHFHLIFPSKSTIFKYQGYPGVPARLGGSFGLSPAAGVGPLHDELVLSVLRATQLDTLDARGPRGQGPGPGLNTVKPLETLGRGARNHHA